MANYSSKLKSMGLAKESVRGTAESAPTVWIAPDEGTEMDYKINKLVDKALRNVMAEYPSLVGTKDGEGTIKMPVRASDVGEFFHMLGNDPTSTEQTTLTIEATNNKIDFTEDGGAEKTATLSSATYAYGTTSATAGTLCAEIKTRLEAANETDATYTVTYSYATKKFTITKNSGVFVFKWATGANTATSAKTALGFSNADTSSQIAQTSDSTTAQWAFKHTFVPLTTLSPQSYSIWFDRSLSCYVYNRCNVASIKLSCSNNGFVEMENKVYFQTEASESIGTQTYVESDPMTVEHVTFKIAGSENNEVKSWDVTLENGLLKKRTMSQTPDITDFVATEYKASGSFVIYFENETERAKYLANTSSSINIDIDGDTIAGSIKYALHLNLYNIQYSAYPFGDEDGLLAAKVTWQAKYSTNDSKIFDIELFNIQSSY